VAVGIAVSLSLATGVQVIAAAVIIRRRLGGTGGGRIARSFARFLVAAIPAAGAGVLVYLGIQSLLGVEFLTSGYVTPLVSMAVIGVVMLAVYLGALALVRSPELADALGPVRARLTRSR
jgi:putative peptidoglycan lipid II flippase